jgi:hypothetical protein
MKATPLHCLLVLSAVASVPAAAARAPDAVEKTITITGDAAASAAELFGLAPAGPSSVSLQLSRPDAWSVYLLKQDTKERIWDDVGTPARYDTVRFSPAPVPSLSISLYWLDLGTRLPYQKVGYFSIDSPFLSEHLTEDGAWTQLVRRLKAKPGWNEAAAVQFRRCVTSSAGAELCIEVLRDEGYSDDNKPRTGHVAVVTAHPKALSDKARQAQ